MKCPVCGLLNPLSAGRCDCGYDFKAHAGGAPASLWVRNRALLLILSPIAAFLLLWLFGWLVDHFE
jgi:hypothetical protein